MGRNRKIKTWELKSILFDFWFAEYAFTLLEFVVLSPGKYYSRRYCLHDIVMPYSLRLWGWLALWASVGCSQSVPENLFFVAGQSNAVGPTLVGKNDFAGRLDDFAEGASIWYEAVAAPQTNPSGNRVSVMWFSYLSQFQHQLQTRSI